MSRGGPSPDGAPDGAEGEVDDAGGVPAAGVLSGLVNLGGPSPDAGAELGGAELGGVAAPAAPGFRVNRGGPSPASIPTGTVSAVCVVFGVSIPTGTQAPVAIHGVWLFAVVLCSAPSDVNSPSELPVRTPSYTVPDSSAIGTGDALYADAS